MISIVIISDQSAHFTLLDSDKTCTRIVLWSCKALCANFQTSRVNREKKSKKYKYFREISHLLCTDGHFTIIMRKLYELAAVGGTYEEIKQRGRLKPCDGLKVEYVGKSWDKWPLLTVWRMLDQGEIKKEQAMLSGLNPQRQHQNV